MKRLSFVLLLLYSLNALGQNTNEYGYPLNGSSKVEYRKSIPVSNAPKDLLYRRALKFITLQEFDRNTEVKTKIRGYYTGIIVDRPIVYQDSDEGKIYGNGWFPFEYRGKGYFVVVYDYKITVDDNIYSYVLSNFLVKEYIHLGKITGTST